MDLVLPNNREYFARLDSVMRPAELPHWQGEDLNYALLAMWWSPGDAFVVLPEPPHAAVRNGVTEVLPNARRDWISIGGATGVCEGLLADRAALDRLARELGSGVVKPRLWAAEPKAYAVLAELRNRGVAIDDSDLPDEAALPALWELDSKSGFRAVASSCTVAQTPRGFVCQTVVDVHDAIADVLGRAPAALVKADRSVGGWGQLTLYTVPSPDELARRFEASGIWSAGPVIVEARIEAVVSPTVDVQVGADGSATIGIVADQVLDDRRACVGARWPSAVTAATREQIGAATTSLARGLAEHGVCGAANIDFVVDAGGTAYMVEHNLRRSTLSALVSIAERVPEGVLRLDGAAPAHARPLVHSGGRTLAAFF